MAYETCFNYHGYRITNPVTGTRVTVGPFKDKAFAVQYMGIAHGLRKKLYFGNKFDFTPSYNGWAYAQADE